MKDAHDLGAFETLEKVWDLYPYGGCPGDFVTVAGVLIPWNDDRRVWGEASDDVSSMANQHVEGNLLIDGDLTIGGATKGKEANFTKLKVESLEVENPPYAGKDHNHNLTYAKKRHKHAVSDIEGFDGNEIVLPGTIENAKHADVAHDLDEDSPVYDKVLRKDQPEQTEHLLKLLGGIFVRGGIDTDSITSELVDAIKVLATDIDAAETVSGKNVLAAAKVAGQNLEAADTVKGNYIEATEAVKGKNAAISGKTTTLNLLVQQLAEMYDLNVSHVATMFRTIIKDYVSSETFIPGLMGEGMKLYKALNGDWNLEIDNLVVRKIMTVFELVISKIRAVNGGLVISPANGTVKSVSSTTGTPSYYVLTIEGDMMFVEHDLVRCQVFTGTCIKYYWVPVASVNKDTILVLKSEFPDGVIPAEGDDLVQMGNTTNKSRQGLLYLTAAEDGKPRISVLDSVNSTSTVGKSKVILGCLDGMTDTDFPADFQPSGYGLYAMNVFLKGIFILRNGKTIESELSTTNAAAKAAKDIADAAKSLAASANSLLTDIANDNKLTATEKQSTKKEWDVIVSEKPLNNASAVKFGVATATYDTAYNALSTYITPLIASLTTTSDIVGATFRNTFKTYYDARTNLLNAVSAAAKALADAAQAKANSAATVGGAAQTKANEAAGAAGTAQTAANNALSAANGANALLSDIANDNKFTPSEKQLTKKEWDAIASEKPLNDASADKFGVVKTTYGTAYTALSTYITPLLTSLTTTQDIVGATFRSTFKTYYDARTNLLNAISAQAKTLADAAQSKADAAKKAADDLGTQLTTIETKFEIREGQISAKVTEVTTKATQAATSATNAKTSETNASGAASTAGQKATAAGNSATAAAGSAATAGTKAGEAATSAANAKKSADDAAVVLKDVTVKESSITQTAGQIATKVTEVNTKVTEANTSATNAKKSETAASGSAATAGTKAGESATSANNAKISADSAAAKLTIITEKESSITQTAGEIATKVTEVTKKATEASTSATNAKTSETNAGTKATQAGSSATAAAGSAATAGTKAADAKKSADDAAAKLVTITQKESSINQTADSITLQVTEVTTKAGKAAASAAAAASSESAAENSAEIAKAMSNGKMLYRDPTFENGANGLSAYNNSGNGVVTVTRIVAIAGCPSTSGYCVKVNSTAVASPGFGGFTFATPTRANAVFVVRVIANIPVGRTLNWGSNATGAGSVTKWLTPQVGTGKWEEYAFRLVCGSTGSFAATNYFYLSGGTTPTASAPLTWYLAYATVFDTTDAEVDYIADAAGKYTTKTEHSSSISQLSDKIELKVAKADFDALGRRVGTAETTITQHTNQISLKASQSDVTALGSRVSSAEAKITPDAIKLTVKSQTDSIVSSAVRRTEVLLDATGLDQSKYYPVTMSLDTIVGTYTISVDRVLTTSYGKPSWSTHSEGFSVLCRWTTNACGWGGREVKRTILDYTSSFASVVPVGSIGQLTNSSQEYIYVRGGSKYRVVVEGATGVGIILRTSDYTHSGSGYTQSAPVLTVVTVPVPDIDAVNTRITNVETSFEIREGQISSKVSQATTSATNAKTSETNAATSASTAGTKATAAGNSATAAAGSATTAGTKAGESATSATNAKKAADDAAAKLVTITQKETSINQTANSINLKATEVTTKATEAAGSASTANSKATAAGASATSAANSASAASGSATTAGQKATAAANSASDAAAKLAAITTKETSINQTASQITIQASTVTTKTAEAINAAELAAAMSKGKMLYRDPTFESGSNGTNSYALVGTRVVEAIAGCPNRLAKGMKITVTGWTSASDLRVGGFSFSNLSRANTIFVVRIIALIPVGRNIQNYHNSYGTGGTTKWLTATGGTGKWEEYACKVTCGTSGTFSTVNHFALTGGVAPTAAAAVTWYVAYATVFDTTDVDDVPTVDEIKAGVTVASGKIGIFGKDISLAGAVTFSSLSPDTQATINGKATTGYVDSSKSAAITDARNNVALKLGYTNYADMEVKAAAGQTIITGGKIRTSLIDAKAIVTGALIAEAINATKISATNLTIAGDSMIAGLRVSGNSLSNEGHDNDAYIILRNNPSGTFVGIGANVLPAMSYPNRATGKFVCSGNYSGMSNTALILEASGSTRDNVALDMRGKIKTDGDYGVTRSFAISSGWIDGGGAVIDLVVRNGLVVSVVYRR